MDSIVKPLEWVDLYGNGVRFDVTVDHPLGYEDSIHRNRYGGYYSRLGPFKSWDHAVMSHQADYEARVLSALTTNPQAMVAAALEQAATIEVTGEPSITPITRHAIRARGESDG